VAKTDLDAYDLFNHFYENMRDAFVSVSMDGLIVECNQEYQAMLGYDADEILKLTYRQLTPEKWHPLEDEIVRTQVLVRGYSDVYEKEYRRKDGTIFPVELRTILIRATNGKPSRMWAIVRDISGRKRAEQTLRSSEEMSRVILNASSASIFLIDPDGTILSVNEAGAQRLNATVAGLTGRNAFDFFPNETSESRKQMIDRVLTMGKPVHYDDYRQGIWFDNSIYPVFDERGQVSRLVVIANDVTERRRMVEALRASEERYRGLAETAQDMIFIIDLEDTIQYVNTSAAQAFGLPVSDLTGMKRSMLFPGRESDRQAHNILSTIRSGTPNIYDAPSILQRKTIWLSTRLVPLKNSYGEIFAVLGVSRDITERVRAQQRLERAHRQLEARVAKRTSELEATQAKLRSLASQIISAQEEERRRVSRELHDDASQMLVSLHYSLAAIMENLSGERSTLERAQMENALKLVDSITDHLRTLGHSLRPPALDVGGIHISLKEFSREFEQLTKIAVNYSGENVPDLPQEISITLYRFVQEALTNVLKHAHADRVRIQLHYKNKGILLSISDNGSGFSVTEKSGGTGLLGIEERINLVGGTLTISSHAGKGARLTARIPWDPAYRQ